MSPSPALTVSRVEVQRSRQLIRDSRVRIASAKEFIHQSRRTISQQTMRWQRAEGAAQGQISHSICFDCFADLLQELAPQNAPPPFSKKVHQRSSYAQPW
jgi:hypothetical protein